MSQRQRRSEKFRIGDRVVCRLHGTVIDIGPDHVYIKFEGSTLETRIEKSKIDASTDALDWAPLKDAEGEQ